jgi:hypothetical protein
MDETSQRKTICHEESDPKDAAPAWKQITKWCPVFKKDSPLLSQAR